jgi:hypothetical protein
MRQGFFLHAPGYGHWCMNVHGRFAAFFIASVLQADAGLICMGLIWGRSLKKRHPVLIG